MARGDGGLGTRGRGWREGCLLGFVVARGAKEEGFSCDGVEIMGGGWRVEESGGWCGGREGAKVGPRWEMGGRPLPLSRGL